VLSFGELRDFITERMRMSHIYQPLLIRSLLEAGGTATVRQLAADFHRLNEPQLLRMEKRIRGMPLRVLRKHGVVPPKVTSFA
jgi:hypothetical protein